MSDEGLSVIAKPDALGVGVTVGITPRF